MTRMASDAFTAWVRETVAPLARASGLSGKGQVFRKRDGEVWTVFAVERQRLDPREAADAADDPTVAFRLNVGLAIPATRPRWDTRTRPPGMHDMTVLSPSRVLEAPDGFWHLFDATDAASQAHLDELIHVGLPEALLALGPPEVRSVLDAKLRHVGPLEGLSPGAAEELLALADLAEDAELRHDIVEALKRPAVPGDRERRERELIEASIDAFGPGVPVVVGWPPRDEEIEPPQRARRRTAAARRKLLDAMLSGRADARRWAATALAAWDGDPEVTDALRGTLTSTDTYMAACAARSLGHLGDTADSTWARSVELAAEADEAPRELGEAIVLLARLDLERRRDEGARTLAAMSVRYPAETRKLIALAGLLR